MSLTQETLRDLLSSLNGGNPERARDLLLRYLPDFVDVYGQTAAVLGADFYDAIRDLPPSAGTASVVLAQPAKQKQADGVVRWALGRIFTEEPDWASFESALLGSAQRLILQPARQTVDLMSARDVASGKVAAVRWAREIHPERAKSGVSCNFCKMLAGRGAVYRSDERAGLLIGGSVETRVSRLSPPNGNDYHDNCHCVPVPTFFARETRTFGGRTESVLVPVSN